MDVRRTEEAAAIEREGRQQVDEAEEQVHPDGSAEEMEWRDPRAGGDRNAGRGGENDAGKQQAEGDGSDGADGGERALNLRGGGSLGRVERSPGEQASGGQQQDATEFQAKPCDGEGAGDFAYGDGQQQQQPEAEDSTRTGARDPAEGERHGEEEQEKSVQAHLDSEEAAYREAPTTHGAIVCVGQGAGGSKVQGARGAIARPAKKQSGDNGVMRVIAGRFRSRLLVAPKGAGTRPTSDRLRETLFNVLAAGAGSAGIDGARFVDLYAGTGAVGIEAMSRGAAHVWLAEKAEPALRAMRANVKTLGIEGEVEIEARGVGALLERLAKAQTKVDLVFLDPPWEAEQEYARTLEFLGGERERAMLAEDVLVIAEHSAKRQLAERYGALVRMRELKQGDAGLSFYRLGRVAGRYSCDESWDLLRNI